MKNNSFRFGHIWTWLDIKKKYKKWAKKSNDRKIL